MGVIDGWDELELLAGRLQLNQRTKAAHSISQSTIPNLSLSHQKHAFSLIISCTIYKNKKSSMITTKRTIKTAKSSPILSIRQYERRLSTLPRPLRKLKEERNLLNRIPIPLLQKHTLKRQNLLHQLLPPLLKFNPTIDIRKVQKVTEDSRMRQHLPQPTDNPSLLHQIAYETQMQQNIAEVELTHLHYLVLMHRLHVLPEQHLYWIHSTHPCEVLHLPFQGGLEIYCLRLLVKIAFGEFVIEELQHCLAVLLLDLSLIDYPLSLHPHFPHRLAVLSRLPKINALPYILTTTNIHLSRLRPIPLVELRIRSSRQSLISPFSRGQHARNIIDNLQR